MTGAAVALRPVGPADLDVLASIEVMAFAGRAWSRRMIADELASADRFAEAAVVDGQLVGYAVTWLNGEVADLQRLVVVPEHRRQGVARALLRSARAIAEAAGANRLLLEVASTNDAALACYVAEGFAQIDRRPRYYPDGSDALVLRAPLGPSCGGSRR